MLQMRSDAFIHAVDLCINIISYFRNYYAFLGKIEKMTISFDCLFRNVLFEIE